MFNLNFFSESNSARIHPAVKHKKKEKRESSSLPPAYGQMIVLTEKQKKGKKNESYVNERERATCTK